MIEKVENCQFKNISLSFIPLLTQPFPSPKQVFQGIANRAPFPDFPFPDHPRMHSMRIYACPRWSAFISAIWRGTRWMVTDIIAFRNLGKTLKKWRSGGSPRGEPESPQTACVCRAQWSSRSSCPYCHVCFGPVSSNCISSQGKSEALSNSSVFEQQVHSVY